MAAAFPWDGHSLTEDLEMRMRLARRGAGDAVPVRPPLRALDPRAFEARLYCAQAYKFSIVLLTAALIYYTRGGFSLMVWFYGVLPGAQAAMLLEEEGWDVFAAYFLQPVLTALRVPIFAAGLLRGRDWWGRTEHASRVAIPELAG